MAKLTRESRLRQRRLDKQAKKDARRQAPANDPDGPSDGLNAAPGEPLLTPAGQPTEEPVAQVLADA